MEQFTYYQWPFSQICLDCVNKTEEILDGSAALCSVNCEDNNGCNCPCFEQAEEEEEEDNA